MNGGIRMEEIISKLFSDYLSTQKVTTESDYSTLSKCALCKEKELINQLNEEQTRCFEELFEITTQLHYLEVKDAFSYACKLGAKISKEFVI